MPKRPKRPAFPEPAIELIAARFKLLSEPTRLKLLMALESGEHNVTELVRSVQATQANVSRHLQALAEVGVLSRRKTGVTVYYAIADPSIFELCRQVCGSLRKRLAEQAKASRWFGR
ncbi:MAG: ArsR/SmtB family transcription factor [Limisphaerales bacterium]